MISFTEAIMRGFKYVPHGKRSPIFITRDGARIVPDGYFSFTFGENNEYELAIEPLIFDDQWYVALYKNKELLTEKIVVKPGK